MGAHSTEIDGEALVEIGGQTMTRAQFDAARYPLLTEPQAELANEAGPQPGPYEDPRRPEVMTSFLVVVGLDGTVTATCAPDMGLPAMIRLATLTDFRSACQEVVHQVNTQAAASFVVAELSAATETAEAAAPAQRVKDRLAERGIQIPTVD